MAHLQLMRSGMTPVELTYFLPVALRAESVSYGMGGCQPGLAAFDTITNGSDIVLKDHYRLYTA